MQIFLFLFRSSGRQAYSIYLCQNIIDSLVPTVVHSLTDGQSRRKPNYRFAHLLVWQRALLVAMRAILRLALELLPHDCIRQHRQSFGAECAKAA
jgi:hypothetical protein